MRLPVNQARKNKTKESQSYADGLAKVVHVFQRDLLLSSKAQNAKHGRVPEVQLGRGNDHGTT